jgi:hypothetical protein
MAGERMRFEGGAAKLHEAYPDDVGDLSEGMMAVKDLMVRTLFAEIWARDVLIPRRAGSC